MKPRLQRRQIASYQVLLPSLDMTGTAGLWRRAAKQRGWTVANSGAVSQDIRSVWPEVLVNQIYE